MSLEFKQVGIGHESGHKKLEQSMHQKTGKMAGAFVYTEPKNDKFTTVTPLINATVGADMNQDVSFGNIPSIIHSGGTSSNRGTGNADDNVENELKDSVGTPFDDVVAGMSVENTDTNAYAQVVTVHSNNRLTLTADIFPLGTEAYAIDAVWVGVAVQGAWNFADSGKITLTAGNQGDEASIDGNTLAIKDWDNFTAFTGKIDLDIYSPLGNNIEINFDLDGVIVGNSILLNDFIDIGNFAEQSFAIPKAEFGLSGQTVNGLTVSVVRTSGSKPTFKLDDLQMEASGNPLSFVYQPVSGLVTRLIAIQAIIVDDVTEANAKDYNSLLGVSALTNGITVSAQSEGKTVFSGTFRRLFDFLQTPNTTFTVGGDATNSWITLNTRFNDNQVILDGNKIDNITYTINDDLSNLLEFRVFVTVTEDI